MMMFRLKWLAYQNMMDSELAKLACMTSDTMLHANVLHCDQMLRGRVNTQQSKMETKNNWSNLSKKIHLLCFAKK